MNLAVTTLLLDKFLGFMRDASGPSDHSPVPEVPAFDIEPDTVCIATSRFVVHGEDNPSTRRRAGAWHAPSHPFLSAAHNLQRFPSED